MILPPPSQLIPLAPGIVFAGRYRVERIVGRGGMGFVYAVEHIDLRQRLALKVLSPTLARDEGVRQGLELEASVFGRIRSPHVVRPLDVGFDEETGCHYLTMELLEGNTLEGLVRTEGPLGPARALLLLQQVAAGLDAAHGYRDRAGVLTPIVHRDLKPANIFVVHPDEEPLVKILDFGLAKLLTDSADLSREVKGTCAYMSSEQANLEPSRPQTDIWALGLVAYFLLTDAAYWRSTTTKEVLTEIVARPPPKARLRLFEQGLHSSLPETFDDWLSCCLHREPSQRFRSAGLAIDELTSLLEASGVDQERPVVLRRDESRRREPLELTQTGAAVAETDLSTLASASRRVWSSAQERIQNPSRLGPLVGAALVLVALVGFFVLGSRESREPRQTPSRGRRPPEPNENREAAPDAPAVPNQRRSPREAGASEVTALRVPHSGRVPRQPTPVAETPTRPRVTGTQPVVDATAIKVADPSPSGTQTRVDTAGPTVTPTPNEGVLPGIPPSERYLQQPPGLPNANRYRTNEKPGKAR